MESQKYTYKTRQMYYRDLILNFFSEKENFERLRRLTKTGVDISEKVTFFLSQEYNYVCEIQGRLTRLHEFYRNVMSNYKKRYYNFLSEKNRNSDLIWQGECNPNIKIFDIEEPLPKLTALKWFISLDLDKRFWENFESVTDKFESHKLTVKTKYTENHKNKKKNARSLIEKEIIANRPADYTKGRKQVYLTRTERRIISSRLEAEKLSAKKRRKNLKLTGLKLNQKVKNPRKTECSCAIILNNDS